MDLSAKDYLSIFIGIIATLIIAFLFGNKINNVGTFSLSDTLLLLVLGIIAIIYFVYKRMGEIDEDIEDSKKNLSKLDERLKIYKLLINLESRIINLENINNDKKR